MSDEIYALSVFKPTPFTSALMLAQRLLAEVAEGATPDGGVPAAGASAAPEGSAPAEGSVAGTAGGIMQQDVDRWAATPMVLDRWWAGHLTGGVSWDGGSLPLPAGGHSPPQTLFSPGGCPHCLSLPPCRSYLHLVYGLSKDWCGSGLRVGILYSQNMQLQEVGWQAACCPALPAACLLGSCNVLACPAMC